jgi:hypothetical protein
MLAARFTPRPEGEGERDDDEVVVEHVRRGEQARRAHSLRGQPAAGPRLLPEGAVGPAGLTFR